jgi:hypothetical protein
MKKIKNLLILTIFVVSIIEFGCKGDVGPAGPTGPPGPSMMGNIIGLVILIDTNGVQPTNRRGITVTVPGTNKTATTDSTGHWALDSMTTGTYEIDISKNTYGNTKHINQQLVGGGTIYIGSDFLSETPSFTVSNLAYTPHNGFIALTGSLSWPTAQTS